MKRYETHAGTPVLDLSPVEHIDLLDREIARRLNMSADEFCSRYIAGELDASDPDVGMLAALLAIGQSGAYI